jgi:hypothetical protein
MQCILPVGTQARFTLSCPGKDVWYMVADALESTLLNSTNKAALHSDSLGLLDFSLSALDPETGTPSSPERMRNDLEKTGLILEWSL